MAAIAGKIKHTIQRVEDRHGKNEHRIIFDMEFTPANTTITHATEAEILPKVNFGLLGGTAAIVEVHCADALDDADNAIGAAHTIRVYGWGINDEGNDGWISEDIDTDGATPSVGVKFFYELLYARVVAWGTGGADAEGAITITKADDTVLLTIAITTNESNGSQLHVPPACGAKAEGGHLTHSTISVAAKAQITRRNTIEPSFGTDPDFGYETLVISAEQIHDDGHEGQEVEPLTQFTHRAAYVSTAALINWRESYLVWEL